jgi:putative acetyltransferase
MLTRRKIAVPSKSEPGIHAGFSIRPAANCDMPAIRSVLSTVRHEYGVLDETGISDGDLDDIELNYFRRGGLFEVVEDPAKRIVGCAGLYPLNQHRAELCKMYLEKFARGRGLGRQLLLDVLAAARRGGFKEVWLETNSVLSAATSLYKKYGFQPIASDHFLPKCDQAYLLRLQ